MAANRVATFLEQLRESQLLEKAALDEVSRTKLAQGDDPMPLARELLQRNSLTSYQVNMLLQGKGRELAVGPYRLLDRLGEGGMGFVYKARHQTMGRTVALKVIRKERVGSSHNVKRFLQEIRAVSQLSHPNIVTAYDTGQVGDLHYYAMEFVDGVDLSRLVKEKGPLPVEQACDYVRQAASGLGHAHEQGLIHRDIKPGNLILSRSGTVKILDMGLARLEGPDGSLGLTKVGTVVGTPEYLAPEQAKDSHNIDPRADLYSLGCTLYYLLTGQPPFKCNSLPELLLKHQTEEPPPLEKYRPEIPPQLWLVVKKLLAKKPEDRYQKASDLALALGPFIRKSTMIRADEPVAQGKPIRSVPSLGVPSRPSKPRRKKRRALVPMLLGLLSMAGAIAAGAYLATQTDAGTATTEPASTPLAQASTITPTVAATRPETKPETKPATKPQPETNPQPQETKPQPPETKPQLPETKPQPPETKPVTKPPETKVVTKPPETKPEKPVPPVPGGKLRVPPPAELTAAQQRVRELYKDEYAKTRRPDVVAFANKLLADATKLKDDPVLQYILLWEAGDRASIGADLDLTLHVIDELDRRFLIDALDLRMGVLDRASRSNELSAMKVITDRTLALAEEAVDHHNFDAAKRLFLIALTAARKAGSPPLLTRVQVRERDVNDIAREHEAVRPAAEALIRNPNDADANLKWGRYLCFFRGNWEDGLPHLLKGNDLKLRGLAGKELPVKPTSPIVQRELGDGWYDVADKYQGVARKNILLRVKYWYEQCVAELPMSIARNTAEKRLKEIAAMLAKGELPDTPVPDKPPPIMPRGTYERELAIGQNSLKLGNFVKAIEGFENALKARPGDTEALRGLNATYYAFHMTNGDAALARKDYVRAANEFNAALKYNPGDPLATSRAQQAKLKVPGK
jgi:serine/threonine protein kinase